MASTITYTHCPACGGTHIAPQLQAEDYTVSHEVFEVWHCSDCTLRFTQHVPDEERIGPYYQADSYVSHSDTQEGLINKVYHRVRNITLGQKKKLILKATGKSIGMLLDVGAGTGAFSNAMEKAGWHVTGLEPDSTARQVALKKFGLVLSDPEKLFVLPDEQFDAITMWHVLEHVHNLHGYMEQFHKILKPRGKLIIAVPNYTSHDAQAYGKYWAAYDVPRHLYHFSPESMALLAKQKSFSISAYKPMWFDSVYVSMLSEQYKNGKPNLAKALFIGLLSNLKALVDNKRCSSVIYVLGKS
ncbi:class I SAM-dependent methyltransferase [Parasediminibacterium sp. JCM 36343]|uniref:class I SAM-dependent methyltransferase n=1 Tax=Parasediminibacterium sp. JCM 36343 TaxID=3374279 RepID=UPI00397C2B45